MFERGKGVLQDYKEAAKWYRLAAEQGDADAQFNLGIMFERGKGVQQNAVLAHMWYNISASNGTNEAINNRDNLAKRMTKEDVSKAQALARECVKNNYRGC